jgi:hypothetical protein
MLNTNQFLPIALKYFNGISFQLEIFNEESQKLNWENKIEKMNKLVRAWGKGNLSILGKIVIIKYEINFDINHLQPPSFV